MADLPLNFLANNSSGTKNPSVVVTIDGVSDVFTNVTSVYTQARYGDTGLVYGQPGLVYGQGLRVWNGGTIRDYLDMKSSSVQIMQKIEPEQGKASTTTMRLAFIDKDGYMTSLCSPGIVLPEMLGREVNVYLGYQGTSYPEDYFRVFRGFVSDITAIAGQVQLEISDPGYIKQQNIFIAQTTTLSASINNSTTTIPLVSNAAFYVPILNVNAAYDSAISCYVKIGDEYIQYAPAGIGTNQYTSVTRGATVLGQASVAVAHTAGDSVQNLILIEDDAILMALKIMLSGWNGNWITGVKCQAFVNMQDPSVGSIAGAILLPLGVDAKKDYGLAVGDKVTAVGGTNAGQTGFITGFVDAFGQKNRGIITGGSFTSEDTTASTLSFRSQYDAYPIDAGLQMTPKDVDVERHIYLRNNFLSSASNSYRFLIDNTEDGKAFIEKEIYLPIGCYAVTRYGRSSVAYTKPPFGSASVVTLDKNNVINPEQIRPFRSTNKRKFFNVISFTYDALPDQTFQTITDFLDTTSITNTKKASTLEIQSRGLRTNKGAAALVAARGQQLLDLYKNCATQIEVKINFGAAAQVEAGDPVFLVDNGGLLIANFQTGIRDLGTQAFTVLERTLDLNQRQGKLLLMTGSGFSPTDRFASIAPSSVIGAGSTQQQLVLTDSYGPIYPKQEYLKWRSYVGLRVWLHNDDYSISDQGGTFLGFDQGNNYLMNVSGFSITPSAGLVLELGPYPTNAIASDQSAAKTAHAFINESLTVTGGSSNTVFSVSSGDAAKLKVGLPVIVHADDYSSVSPEVTVLSVVSTTVTVSATLGFTPSAGHVVDLVGFLDGGQPYRWV